MSLSRSKPIPSHDFPDQGQVRTCGDCGAVWNTSEYDDPPPWPCKRKPLERTSRLSPVSRSNSAHRGEDDAFRRWVKRLPCVACGSPPPSDPHHVRTRNSGHSDWLLRDGERVGNLTPLCRSCHDSLDAVGGGKDTFESEHGISLAHEARRLGERWRGRG